MSPGSEGVGRGRPARASLMAEREGEGGTVESEEEASGGGAGRRVLS